MPEGDFMRPDDSDSTTKDDPSLSGVHVLASVVSIAGLVATALAFLFGLIDKLPQKIQDYINALFL